MVRDALCHLAARANGVTLALSYVDALSMLALFMIWAVDLRVGCVLAVPGAGKGSRRCRVAAAVRV